MGSQCPAREEWTNLQQFCKGVRGQKQASGNKSSEQITPPPHPSLVAEPIQSKAPETGHVPNAMNSGWRLRGREGCLCSEFRKRDHFIHTQN